MKRGKKICETLKAIRSEIASANEIEYTPIKCDHKGDCAGTCPACESETRWLERQLCLRHALGKAMTIAGVSVALTVAASAATPSSLTSDKKKSKHRQRAVQEEATDGYVQKRTQNLMGSDTIVNDDGTIIEVDGLVTRFSPHPDSIYTNVTVEAEFPGGDEALDQLIRSKLVVPDGILATFKEIGGTVKARCIVKAVIEPNGKVSDAVIEKTTTSALFDEEALRVVKGLPKFHPARIKSTPVRSWKKIPVEFVYDFSSSKQKTDN